MIVTIVDRTEVGSDTSVRKGSLKPGSSGNVGNVPGSARRIIVQPQRPYTGNEEKHGVH
jgi:hypothetical protein